MNKGSNYRLLPLAMAEKEKKEAEHAKKGDDDRRIGGSERMTLARLVLLNPRLV